MPNSQYQLKQTPLSQEFLDFFSNNKMNIQSGGFIPGHIPVPVKVPQVKNGQKSVEALPASFDLRIVSPEKLTPVKNQGPHGTCWAFATLGSMESCQLPEETYDFSENNLINTHGFDWGPDTGGNSQISTAYMARWSGPVYESDDPYYNPVPNPMPPRKHIQEVLNLPDRTGSLDNDTIKQAIMDYGAVYTAMNWNDACYNPVNFSYYSPAPDNANHAVAFIGWDDNYPAANFTPQAPGNGAFILRNSWGTSWGEAGYFYASYYDVNLQEFSVFSNAEKIDNFASVYQYDPFGHIGNVTYGGLNDSIWMANVFTAISDEPLTAIGFYTIYPGSEYEISIYRDNAPGNPSSGVYSGGIAGFFLYAGYHTIILDSPIPITNGQSFSVVIKLTKIGYGVLAATEIRLIGYDSAAVSYPGESYASPDGSTWEDLYDYNLGNMCIKAFTRGSVPQADLVIDKYDLPDPVMINNILTYSIKVTNKGTGTATNVVMTDKLPSETSFISASLGAYNPDTGVLTANIGTLSANAEITIVITVKTLAAGIITNTAFVTSDQTAEKTIAHTTAVLETICMQSNMVLDTYQFTQHYGVSFNWKTILNSNTAPSSADCVITGMKSYINALTVPDMKGMIQALVTVSIEAWLKLVDNEKEIYYNSSFSFNRQVELYAPGQSSLSSDIAGASTNCTVNGDYVFCEYDTNVLAESRGKAQLRVLAAGSCN
ncbi:MAG: lectin like domain-containing protein [Clostridia bacterium]|nr:lectin like domain-containing protein [Clostridia bacterium]